MVARFIAANASTGGAVTVNLDTVGASTIVLPGGGNPASGDISTSTVNTIRYDLGNTRWELQGADSVLESNIFPAESQAANGYIQLKGGIIIQWGNNATSTGGSTHSFPTTFSSVCWTLCATGENGLIYVQADILSTSQFTLTSHSGTPSASWIAIGV